MFDLTRSCSRRFFALALLSGIALFTSDAHAQVPTVTFSGITWIALNSQRPIGAGPNIYRAANVSVDELGRLHLFLRCSGEGTSRICTTAEVIATPHPVYGAYSYGTYTWEVDSPLPLPELDAVLGLFNYADEVPHAELDVEAGVFREGTNFLHSYQPNSVFYFLPDPLRDELHDWDTSTHTINWKRNCVKITSTSRGGAGRTITTIFNTSPLPQPGTFAHANLWFKGGPDPGVLPSNELEVIIRSFVYKRNNGAGACK